MNSRANNVRSSSLSNSRRPAYGVTGSVVRRQRRDTSHLPVGGAVAWELTRGPCPSRAEVTRKLAAVAT
jgi:hypothetical protein